MTESPLISNPDPMGKKIPKTLPSQLPSAVPKIQKPPSSGNSKPLNKSKTATVSPLLLQPKTKKKSIFNPQLLPNAMQNETRLEVMHYELKKKSQETVAAESRRKPIPDDEDDEQMETNKRTLDAKRRPQEIGIRKPQNQNDATKERFPEEETEKPVKKKTIPVMRVSVRQDGVALENKRVSPEKRRSERQIEKKSMDIENRKESLSKEKSKDTPKGSKQKDSKQKDSKRKDSQQKDSKRKDSKQKDSQQKDSYSQQTENRPKRKAVTKRQEAMNRKNSIESESSVSKEKEKQKNTTIEVKTRALKRPTLAPPKQQQPKPAETKIDLDTRKELLEEAHKRKSYRRLVPFPGHKSALLPGNLKPKRDTYNVEEILDKKMLGRNFKYLIKWEGYPDEENSWEPRKNLPKEMVDEFEETARDRLGASSSRVEEEAEDNDEEQEEREEQHPGEMVLEDLKPKAENLKPKTLKEAGENMVPVVKRSKERKGVEQVLEQKDASYEEVIEEENQENIEEPNNEQKEVAINAEPNEEGKTNVEEKKLQTENPEGFIMKTEEEKNGKEEKTSQERMEIEQEKKETTVEKQEKISENNNSQKETKPDTNDCVEAEMNSKHQLPTMSKKIKKILKKNNKAVAESSSRAATSKKTGKKYDDPDPMVINSDAEGLSINRASKFGDFRLGDRLKVIRKIRYNKKLRAVYALVEWNQRENGYVPLSSKVDLENLKAHAPSETINFLVSILIGERDRKAMNGN